MAIKNATKRIPNVYELFYDKQGDLLQSPDTISFKAQDNYANLLVINLEDGIEDDSILLINFTPNNAVVNYTSHWFYVRPSKNIREYTIMGESIIRVFTSYVFEIPRLVLNNFSNNTTVENQMSIAKRYGIQSVGAFNTFTELVSVIPPTKELFENNAFAYVLNEDLFGNPQGYYQVIQEDMNVYNWVIRDNVMNFGLEQKQYEVKTAFIEKGYANVQNVPTVEGTVVEALWRDLSVLFNRVDDLEAFYDLEFIGQETNTVETVFTKVTNSQFTVESNVKINNNENDLLVSSENGLYVKHDVSKQDKLFAGVGIEIDEETNTISASGGGGGNTFFPDGVTIKLNHDNELEVDIEFLEDGGFL